MMRRLPLLATFLLLVPSAAAQTVPLTPEQIHVTLGETPGTLVVHWALTLQPYPATHTPIVVWDNGSAPGRLVGTIKPGTAVSLRGTGPQETYVYAATIGPFPPGTQITYQVGASQSGRNQLSPPRTVSVPPAVDQTLRLVAYGDIGIDGTAADGSRMPSRASHPAHDIRDLTIAQKPDLFLIPGDLSYTNTRDGWDAFMRFSEPLQSTVVTMPVAGNHEWEPFDNLGYAQFLNTYVLPADEHNYVFQAGPVTFVGVNSDMICQKPSRSSTGTPPRPCDPLAQESVNQALLDWLDQALARANADATPWTIVYHHHPAYSWGSHGSDYAVQGLLAPLYARHSVDLVLTAHDHLYTRSHPVIDHTPLANGTEYTKGLAPVYVVAGGGGRSLYNVREGTPPAWLAHAEKVHHLVRVDALPQRLDVVALRADGSEMDAFRIVSAVDAEMTRDPAPAPSLPGLLGALALALFAWRRRRQDPPVR